MKTQPYNKGAYTEAITVLKGQIAYEKQATVEMLEGNASIPKGWTIGKQAVYVQGMQHALSIIRKYKNY
jgi:hypothetical protein